jgi:hypothetical protein
MPLSPCRKLFFVFFVFLILSESFTWLLSYCTCNTDYYYKGTYFVCATSESKKQLTEMVIVRDEKKSVRKWLGRVWYARKFQPSGIPVSLVIQFQLEKVLGSIPATRFYFQDWQYVLVTSGIYVGSPTTWTSYNRDTAVDVEFYYITTLKQGVTVFKFWVETGSVSNPYCFMPSQ